MTLRTVSTLKTIIFSISVESLFEFLDAEQIDKIKSQPIDYYFENEEGETLRLLLEDIALATMSTDEPEADILCEFSSESL